MDPPVLCAIRVLASFRDQNLPDSDNKVFNPVLDISPANQQSTAAILSRSCFEYKPPGEFVRWMDEEMDGWMEKEMAGWMKKEMSGH